MLYCKIIASALLAGVIFTGTVEAYDLPKIKADKKVVTKDGEVVETKIFASDWKENERFIAQLKALLEENGNLPASSPARTSYDKNRVFIAFYKGNAYFLDKYSVHVTADFAGKQSWTQRIFPIGENISPKNAQSTSQEFCFDGKNFYNSQGKNNPLDAMTDEEDKNFLHECFRIGYYFAFNEDLNYKEK